MNEFIKYVVEHQKGRSQTASGIKYLIMPRNFHPLAAVIPYFALGDNDSQVFAVSEDVPEMFRDVWILHEKKCVGSGWVNCFELTEHDIRIVETLYFRHEYELFLKLRLAMYQGLVDHQSNSPHCGIWNRIITRLEYAISRM